MRDTSQIRPASTLNYWSMSNDGTKIERPWRDIAEELSKEHDGNKIAELSQELIETLDKEGAKPYPQQKPNEQQTRRKAA